MKGLFSILLSIVFIVSNVTYAARGEFCTGFLISGEGDIATAKHCIPKTNGRLFVKFKDKIYPASVRAVSPINDIAIISIGVQTPYFNLAAHSYAGDGIFSLGFPNPEVFDFQLLLFRGIVVGKASLLNLNMYCDKGASGEPILNVLGEVEGVLSAGEFNLGVAGTFNSFAEPVENLIVLASLNGIKISISSMKPVGIVKEKDEYDLKKANADKVVSILEYED